MAIIYCQMCGSAMEVRADATTVECGHCGAWQILPASLWKLRASASPVSEGLSAPPAQEPAAVPAEPAVRTAPAAPPAQEPAAAPAEPAVRTVPAVPPEKPARRTVIGEGAASLLYRMLQSLSAGDWRGAAEYSESVLRLEPECAEAYLGKLMAEVHASRPEQLGSCEWPLDGFDSYRKAVRFAEEGLRAQLETYLEQTRAKIPQHYAEAKRRMEDAYFNHYEEALRILEKIPDYEDAKDLIEICKRNIVTDPEETQGCGRLVLGLAGFAVLLMLTFFFLHW